MGKYSEFAGDPIGWLAGHSYVGAPGDSYHELKRYFTAMENSNPGGAMSMAKSMVDRTEVPRLVRQPDNNAMFLMSENVFDGQRHPDLVYSTHGDLNPYMVRIGDRGQYAVFEHPRTRWSANVAGLDPETGQLCDGAACLPRSVFGASSADSDYMTIYDDILEFAVEDAEEMQSSIMDNYGAELAHIFGEDMDFISHELDDFIDRPSYNASGIYEGSGAAWLRSGNIIRKFNHVPLPGESGLVKAQDFSRMQSPEAIQKMYDYIPANYPNSVVFIRTKNNTGHAIGYRNGLQLRTHMGDAYDASNTEKITDVLSAK